MHQHPESGSGVPRESNGQSPDVVHRDFSLCIFEAVNIGIEGKERVGVIEGSEEFPANLIHSFCVKLQVYPTERSS